MAFASFDNRAAGAPQAEINMVPLIDVMLVLLVIFIVAAPMLTHSVPLDLPKASSTATLPETHRVTLSIDAGRQIYWDGQVIDAAQLDGRLKQQALSHPETQLQLHADRQVPYGSVAEVLAAAARAHLTRVAFVSDPSAPAAK